MLTQVVPSSATVDATYSRFRFSSAGGLSVTGLADDGEVEDYQVSIQFACGDRNISVADAIYTVGYIYGGGPAPIGEADVNLDGRTTVADVVYIVGYIYGGGPSPCNPPATSAPFKQNRMKR